MNFNGLEVKNRMIASTAFKYGSGFDFTENPWTWAWRKAGLMNVNDFGAVDTKTLTMSERSGFYTSKLVPWKVIRMYPTKVDNRFGWNNCGIAKFISDEVPKLKERIHELIVNIGALESIDEIFYMLDLLNEFNLCGITINVSCHNVELDFLNDMETIRKLFQGARRISRHPLIVKINAESDYVTISKIAQDEGINLIHAINTLRVYSKKLDGYCGRSSYKNKEVALRVISELRKNGILIPVIGGSGIWMMQDIVDYASAGANLFSMSHQFLYLPCWPGHLAKKIK